MKALMPMLCLSLTLVVVAPAADSLNVRLIGYCVQPYGFDVAVSGDYAYVAARDSFCVISVNDPANPLGVGYCDTVYAARGVAVVGDLAYVADCTDGYVRVFSVADPEHPAEVGECRTPNQAIAIDVSEGYAYVADALSGLRVISVADPAHPEEVGYCDTPAFAYNVAVVGDYAYVADCPGGLRIISVTDPTHPSEVGSYEPGQAQAVAVNGDYAYLGCADSSFRVVSVADPARPTEVGYCDLLGIPQDVAFIGDYAFAATWGGGLEVISVADPMRPSEVGHYGTPFQAYGVAVDEDYAYVVGDNGLAICEFFGNGVEEAPNAELGSANQKPTVVRGVLVLGAAGSRRQTVDRTELLDAAGRKVADLHAGANDVSRLAPGVYFVRPSSDVMRDASSITKIVITR